MLYSSVISTLCRPKLSAFTILSIALEVISVITTYCLEHSMGGNGKGGIVGGGGGEGGLAQGPSLFSVRSGSSIQAHCIESTVVYLNDWLSLLLAMGQSNVYPFYLMI